MSLQAALITALAGVAGGRVYPQMAPENTPYPLVNYRVLNREPIVTIHGTVLAVDYQVVFECWGATYASAMSTSDAVRAAIRASGLRFADISEPAAEYDATADSFMEPVYFEFTYA